LYRHFRTQIEHKDRIRFSQKAPSSLSRLYCRYWNYTSSAILLARGLYHRSGFAPCPWRWIIYLIFISILIISNMRQLSS